MYTPMAVFFAAVALRLRYHQSNEWCVKEAADLWRLVMERV